VGEALTLSMDRVRTPIGELLLLVDPAGRLRALDWEDHEPRLRRLLAVHDGAHGVHVEDAPGRTGAGRKLSAYFDGDVEALADVPVATGGTAFQREVWAALREIPCGRTESYGALARRIRRPSAVRAVGLANGANPIGIVVPCHRVVGHDGRLTGYAGGLERKRWLLEHEARSLACRPSQPVRPAAALAG
jgi:methylated-DNA-[protein]-cysteine S-methyltransferase